MIREDWVSCDAWLRIGRSESIQGGDKGLRQHLCNHVQIDNTNYGTVSVVAVLESWCEENGSILLFLSSAAQPSPSWDIGACRISQFLPCITSMQVLAF